MTADTRDMLTNREIIAVDQDSKGIQGHRIWQEGPLEIWAKPLADGNEAVGLFNRGESELNMTLQLASISKRHSAKLRDLWEQKDLGTVTDSYSATVPKHGVLMLKVFF
jgi:alpha-galactosidase